jgi:hypothetical protein
MFKTIKNWLADLYDFLFHREIKVQIINLRNEIIDKKDLQPIVINGSIVEKHTRKVIVHGSSLAVTHPKEWIAALTGSLNPGGRVETALVLDENHRKMILITPKGEE